ncbi:hypothetical protein PG985_008006 [Apiospora marii]|uniref:Fungal N-terminal domain-containing protein n=1 Tax=Apiospora marii TaxID=335849 RepID=A0ABR1R9B0_9PEZI
MADPLSQAASVAGLVSLGIQVTTGISKYLDALDSRDEELRSATQQNEALRNTVTIIEKAVERLDQVSPDASSAAKENVKLCKECLDNLETFVARLAGSDVGTWRSRLKTGKFHYVFDRPKVLQLSARVSQTNSDLQLAVEGLGLSTVSAIHQSVTDIQSEVPGLQSGIRLVRDQLHAHHQASTQRMVDHVREQQLTTRLQNGYLERNQEQNAALDDRMATVERKTHVMEAMLALVLLNGASDGLPDDSVNCSLIAA